MTRNTFFLKIQRELCHPKDFGTFEKRAPGPMVGSVDRGQCFRVTPCFPDNLNKSSWSYETSVHRRGTLKLLGWSCTVRVYKGPRGALEYVINRKTVQKKKIIENSKTATNFYQNRNPQPKSGKTCTPLRSSRRVFCEEKLEKHQTASKSYKLIN